MAPDSHDTDQPAPRPNSMAAFAVETRAVHAGERALPTRAIPTSTPIHRSATFVYESAEELEAVFAGDHAGYVYSRLANPTVAAAETAVGALEGAAHCVAFSSGMAALHAALLAAGVGSGDRVVAALDLYAATYTLLNSVLHPLGVRTTFVDIYEPGALAAALVQGDVRALLVESLSNPLLRVADVPEIARLAHAHGATLIVDATFAPPPMSAPLAQGADLVVHSATKYLGGHADLTAGVVYGNGDVAAALRPLAQTLGSGLAPNEAWLLLRGLKTMPLRLRRQCASARFLARRLALHPRLAAVHYPGLAFHPHHAVARRLFRPGWHGGMIAIELRDAAAGEVHRFLNGLCLCLPTTSLGDIYTLVSCPAMASHRELSPRQCQRMGITPGLIRLSIGIEHPADLASDLLGALSALDSPPVFTPAAHQFVAGAGDDDDEEPAP